MARTHQLDDLYPLILDSLEEGVFTIDLDFRITSLNAAGERILKIRRDDAIGMRCRDVFRASICQTECALHRTLETEERLANVRVTILDADMEEIPICISTGLLRDATGTVVGGVEVFRDISDVEALRSQLRERRVFMDMVGVSRPMRELFAILPDVAATAATVLVQGPSGSGKELVAHAVHDLSPRRTGPFVALNCGALPDALLESELFGYVKGAFTDAVRDKPGRFVQADGGTLFLDEIGDTTAAFQVKLLRVLETGEVQALGATEARKADVRIVAATNRDLKAMVDEGAFRADLFYRLNVVPLSIPPLCERRADIPALVDHLLVRIAARHGVEVAGVTAQAMEALYDYDFPGNVRELENILERAVVISRGDAVGLEHLPAEVLAPPRDHGTSHEPPTSLPLQSSNVIATPAPVQMLGGVRDDRAAIIAALEANAWRRDRAAEALGMSRTTLWRRMKRLGIDG